MSDPIDYTANFRQLTELINQSSEKKLSFFRHIQLVTVSTLAIVVAFLQNADGSLYLRILFAMAILSLSLCILTTGIVIYNLTNFAEEGRRVYHAELEKAILEKRKMNMVSVPEKKISKFCQKYSYILLFLSLFLLTLFAVLSVLSF
jgi:hypothetical protein